MPTLADIYSAINTAQRKGGDFIRNPGASLQQMLGYANDRARNFNELNDQALAEMEQTGKLTGPAGQQLMQTMSEAYNPIGMTVYHGSPHVFEKFDLSKMGTGEGAQAYGKGMYVAQNPQVAEGYQIALASKNNASLIKNGPNSYDVIAPNGEKLIENAYLGKASKVKYEHDMSQEGSLYKVDLPDTHVRRMLDWDAPIKDQPYPVRNLAKKLGMDMNDLGGDLIGKIGKGEEGKQILQGAGIPGIKYFDQLSRGEQTGSRNFVVFDPNHLTILERNSQPIK